MTAYHTTDVKPHDIKYSTLESATPCSPAEWLKLEGKYVVLDDASYDKRVRVAHHGETAAIDIPLINTDDACHRGSYSSVKEDGDGTAQSFVLSPKPKTDIAKSHENTKRSSAVRQACACLCRCGRSSDISHEASRAAVRSKSYSPIRTYGFNVDPNLLNGLKQNSGFGSNPPAQALLERLPAEILDKIISHLTLDIPTEYTPRNADLASCLLTSRAIHAAALIALYKHVTIPHSLIFSKFLGQVTRNPDLGTLIRRLDLSHFTSLGLGRTKKSNLEIQNMTARTLLKCLELTPAIQEVLLQEHLDQDIDEAVVRKLLFGLPNLQALDFCASSTASFVEAFSSAITDLKIPGSPMLPIQRLSLHECFTLYSHDLELLLSRLPRLTHLDLSRTRVTDKALDLIPQTAHLTHLNLGRCTQISGKGVVEFIASHPAARDLVYLNLSSDISRYRLLWEADVAHLLESLPQTLRSLNLSGAKLQRGQISSLIPLTKHLEELSLGYAEISVDDIKKIFVPNPSCQPDKSTSGREELWIPCTLRYLDLTGIAEITQGSLFSRSDSLLGSASQPLEVLEFSDKIITALHSCKVTNKRYGWVVKELGRRGWYVRQPGQDAQTGGKGRRSWKMGSMWWGMRKIPVAYGEVGGLYGHYMFKK